MIINWFFIPTLVIALFLTWIGWNTVNRTRNHKIKYLLLAAYLIAALPAFTFAYPEFMPQGLSSLYCSLRATRGSELMASGIGLLMGGLAGILAKRVAAVAALVVFTVIWVVMIPYLDQSYDPLHVNDIKDSWDGISYQQTTKSTCSAASAATVLRQMGVDATESEVAKRAYTTCAGTYTWYLMRAIRSYGVRCHLVISKTEIPAPCLMSIHIGCEEGYGHMMPVLGRKGDLYVLPGHPEGLSLDELKKKYFISDEFIVLGEY